MNTKSFLNTCSGVLAFVIPGIFAVDIYVHHLHLNFATWLMVLLLDVLGFLLALKAGNKRPYLQFGWMAAAILIIIAILMNGSSWEWGPIESLSFLFCIVAVIFWLMRSATSGLWFYLIAIYISFIPQAVSYWHSPDTSTWYLWAGSVFTCILAIIAAEKHDSAHVLTPWACVILNLGILLLLFR